VHCAVISIKINDADDADDDDDDADDDHLSVTLSLCKMKAVTK